MSALGMLIIFLLVVIWILLSKYFEKIGDSFISFFKNLLTDDIDKKDKEKENHEE